MFSVTVTHSESQPVAAAAQWLTHLHTLATAGQTDGRTGRKEGSTDREATLKGQFGKKEGNCFFWSHSFLSNDSSSVQLAHNLLVAFFSPRHELAMRAA